MIKIAVMGYGVVGSGVVEVFYNSLAHHIQKAGHDLELKYILDLREFPGSPYAGKFIKDFSLIENDPEIGIVVEVMGGLNPAFDYVRRCLEKKKSVVTSNKELVACKGYTLLETARQHNVNFLFEASVGGGIPIIRPIAQCLAANNIDEISGILNGTTNFILTKMIREQMDFATALAMAQELGYAERNPDADVLGHDTCRKICILASLAFGKHVYPDQVHTEGIDKITLTDVDYAASWGGVIKLIGRAAKKADGRLTVTVMPELVCRDSPLAGVEDVFNAIEIKGDAIGEVMFYGRGAGKLPTASAVMADVIDCAKHTAVRKMQDWEDGVPEYVSDFLDDERSLYLRFRTQDRNGLLDRLNAVFGGVQPLSLKNEPADELAVITSEISRRAFFEKLAQITGITPVSMMSVKE